MKKYLNKIALIVLHLEKWSPVALIISLYSIGDLGTIKNINSTLYWYLLVFNSALMLDLAIIIYYNLFVKITDKNIDEIAEKVASMQFVALIATKEYIEIQVKKEKEFLTYIKNYKKR